MRACVVLLLSTELTIHDPGIEQHLTPWSDGVPGVTQRQIQPGNTFVYRWTATQYGSYWYHAHQRGQLEDGMYGAIIIHPKKSLPAPFSLISSDSKTLKEIEKAASKPTPLILSDWRKITAHDIDFIEREANMELPCFDSILFNGKGSIECWAAERIDALLNAQQRAFLKIANVTSYTAKGYVFFFFFFFFPSSSQSSSSPHPTNNQTQMHPPRSHRQSHLRRRAHQSRGRPARNL